MFLAAALLTCGKTTVRGQSALDGFDANADGLIRVVVVQPDGKILIGGDFTTVSPNGGAPVTRNRIARLNPDGTVDPGFDPNANNSVYAIAVQADGKILVSGAFSGMSSIGGQARNRIARLDPSTGLADSFNPSANGLIIALALQADGKILVGGSFQNIGGQSRNYIARLDATTGLADSFDPHSNNLVLSIAVQADGRILAGGAFAGPGSSIGGATRNHIVRLDPATGLADAFDPNASSLVQAIALQADGKILVGGTFFSIGGQTRIRMARLDAITGLADSFDPNANNAIQSIAVQADGKILAGGQFSTIGGQTRNYIARLDATTGLADSFDPNASSSINSIAVQADGKILAGGGFTSLAPNGGASATRNRIARLESDGRLDQTLNLGIVGSIVSAIAVQPDGKMLIGGSFNSVLGVPRNYIARLNPDGTLDTAFDPNANNPLYAIAVQADGKILIGGIFTTIGGQPRNRIARLDPVTGLADTFNPNANAPLLAIAVQPDGRILAGGLFSGANSIGGQPRNRIARLDPVTGSADSFNPNANGIVHAISGQADGKILAGGEFTSIGGQPRNRIARLDPTTGSADSWNPNANNAVYAIALQADGKILAGGGFYTAVSPITIGGQQRNHIARLDPNTGLADSWAPDASGTVVAIAVQADGKILAGGYFSSIGGQTRHFVGRLDPITGQADSFNPGPDSLVDAITLRADGKILAGGEFSTVGVEPRRLFARLSNDTAALQYVAVTQSTVTWTLGGASPRFARVTFEYSTDNVHYTPLGNGAPTGSNWTLTCLSFPTGQNFYIRARGYYRGGYRNGSESLAESVRNVFISAAPLQLTTAGSYKVHGAAGTFAIPLPLKGDPGVECRSSGGAHTLAFFFTNNVVSGNASVTAGTGSVSGSPTFSCNVMTVNLTGVTDVQKITVTLNGVTDGLAQVLPSTAVSVNMLIGDINGSKAVSTSDIGEVKARAGNPIDATSFRADVAVNGAINTSDIGLVKSRSGQSVP